ncbi:4-phosphoerythronate dehydrogenase [Mycena sanguinolenta]|nr:4-phosphoerythronate dehydrogenase [Mycena sanguinolenta]KAJ6458749.1 4-phosphoerythronate dehydrogenase [Mycena sanguinolenta]
MASFQHTILYPQLMPDDTEATQSIEQRIFGDDTRIIRLDVERLSDVPDEICKTVHGLMDIHLQVTDADLERFPLLRAIVRMGVGTDDIDIAAAAKRNITVHNVPDYGTDTVATHTIGLILTLLRDIHAYHDRLRKAPNLKEAWIAQPSVRAHDPSALTLGLIGCGRIGGRVAEIAMALKFHVVAFDPFVDIDQFYDGITQHETAEEVYKVANVLTLHTPLTDETSGMIGAPQLGLLPDNALVINTSRGEVIHLDALDAAIRSGRVAGAALDVLPDEHALNPLPKLIEAYRASDEFICDRLILTPHSAFLSKQSLENIHIMSAKTMCDALAGKRTNLIKPGKF